MFFQSQNKGVDLHIIKKLKNENGKWSYRINKETIKESKGSYTEEIFENDDTLSYIDKRYEEVRYKALREKWYQSRYQSIYYGGRDKWNFV